MTVPTGEIKTLEEIEAPNDDQKVDPLKAHRKKVQRKRKTERSRNSLGRDVAGWLIIIGSVAWLLALISFDPSDPSSFNRTIKEVPDNLLGRVGSWISAWCYQLTGFGGLLMPMGSLYLGVLWMRAKKVNDWFFQTVGGATLVFVFMTALGSLPALSLKGHPLTPGGVIGKGLWSFFATYLNAFGAYLLMFALVGLAVLVATRLTLRDLGALLLNGLKLLWAKMVQGAQGLWSLREARDAEKVRTKIIKRELDRIDEERRSRDLDEEYPLTTPDSEVADDLTNLPMHDTPEGGNFADLEPDVLVGMDTGDQSETPNEPSLDLDDPPASDFPMEEEEATSEELIKVNPMKRQEPVKQEAFQFVEDLEGWVFPSSFLFGQPDETMKVDEKELLEKAKALEGKFGEFSVTGQMREIHPGPVVTTYEFKPDAGIKYSKVVNLAEDLCLELGAESIRIDRMPGRSAIGLEVPNNKRELITFREMIEHEQFRNSKSKMTISLGKTIDGTPFFADLAKMPHLLIAGQTGSGKSVGINAMICSILMRARPDEVKLIMIDPKMVEMGIYRDIPHLLTPVVIDPQEASNSLKWAVGEMERRYKLLAANNFRNLDHYNNAVANDKIEYEEGQERLQPLPLIIIFIDELADLMMVARGEVEESIARLAQKSRAIGIHLVLATQRPSVDIITGVIKSNLPSRLSYRVAQKNDSRIILDGNGAETLLGKGDGLFLGPGTARLVRIHAPYLSEAEVLDLVKFLKNQGKPVYNHQVIKPATDDGEAGDAKGKKGKGKKGSITGEDPMYDKAARLVVRSGQASVSYLQRKLGLGYARAAKLVDLMEDDGIVGPNLGSKARDILVPGDYFDAVDSQIR